MKMRMTKKVRIRTAIHEAGHLVMRWYLGFPATRTVIFENGTESYCERGSGYETENDDKLICLAGFAAEGNHGAEKVKKRLFFLLDDREYYAWEDLDRGHDVERLWKRYLNPGPLKQAGLMRKFFEARYILRRYRAHVEEVADILLAQKELSEADGTKLFHKWGEPDLDVMDNYDSSRNYKKSMDIFMPLTKKEENEVSRIRHVTNFCMDLHFDEKIGNDSVRIVRYHAGRSVMDWYLRTIPDEDAELLRLASGFAAAFRRTPLVFDRMVKMWLERPDQYSFHNPELCAGFKNLQGGCLARRGGAKSAAKLMIRS